MTDAEREATRRYVEGLEKRYATLRDAVREDVDPEPGLSFEEIDRRAAAHSRATWKMIRAMPPEWRAKALAPDPPAPDFEAIWKRLVRQYRERGSGGG